MPSEVVALTTSKRREVFESEGNSTSSNRSYQLNYERLIMTKHELRIHYRLVTRRDGNGELSVIA